MSRPTRLLIRRAPSWITIAVVTTLITATGHGLTEYLFWLGGYLLGILDMMWDRACREADRQADLWDEEHR